MIEDALKKKTYVEGQEDRVPSNYENFDDGSTPELDSTYDPNKDPEFGPIVGALKKPFQSVNLDPINIEGEVPTTKSAAKDTPLDLGITVNPVSQAGGEILGVLKKAGKDFGEQILEPAANAIGPAAREFAAKLDQGADYLKEKSNAPHFWEGMAPVLMGALMGDIGAGAAVGADNLYSSAAQDQKDLDAIMKSRASASSSKGTGSLKKVLKDGKSYWVPADEAVYQQVGSAEKNLDYKKAETQLKNEETFNLWKRQGKNIDYKKDELGTMYAVDKLTGDKRRVFSPQGLAPKHLAIAEKKADKFNKKTESIVDDYRDMQRSLKGLLSKGQLNNKLSLMGLVKTVETRLSDQDRNYYAGEVSALQDIYKLLDRETRNRVNPDRVKEALTLVSQAMSKSKGRYGEIRKNYSSQLSGLGIPSDRANKVFGDMPKFSNSVRVVNPRTGDILDIGPEQYLWAKDSGLIPEDEYKMKRYGRN